MSTTSLFFSVKRYNGILIPCGLNNSKRMLHMSLRNWISPRCSREDSITVNGDWTIQNTLSKLLGEYQMTCMAAIGYLLTSRPVHGNTYATRVRQAQRIALRG